MRNPGDIIRTAVLQANLNVNKNLGVLKMGNRKDNFLIVLKNGPKEESSEWVIFKQSVKHTVDLVIENSRADNKDKHLVKAVYRFETNGKLTELELGLKDGIISLLEKDVTEGDNSAESKYSNW